MLPGQSLVPLSGFYARLQAVDATVDVEFLLVLRKQFLQAEKLIEQMYLMGIYLRVLRLNQIESLQLIRINPTTD